MNIAELLFFETANSKRFPAAPSCIAFQWQWKKFLGQKVVV